MTHINNDLNNDSNKITCRLEDTEEVEELNP